MSVIETKDDTKSFDKTTGFKPGTAGVATLKGCSLGALAALAASTGVFRAKIVPPQPRQLGKQNEDTANDKGRKNGEARHNEIGAPASGIKVRLANKS
jgi:hypothetical protein